MEFSYHPINPIQYDGLSRSDRMLIDGMRNTAYVCGYRGEDVEYAVHQALKRVDRYDLLPPYYHRVKEIRQKARMKDDHNN